MRAAVVDGEKASIVSKDGDSLPTGRDYRAAVVLELGDGYDAYPLGGDGADWWEPRWAAYIKVRGAAETVHLGWIGSA